MICTRCEFVDSTFEEIKELIVNYKKSKECGKRRKSVATEIELEEIGDRIEEFEMSVEKIMEMKHHFIRAARSQQARKNSMSKLSPTIGLVTVDWAQKMDQIFFHETQRASCFIL